MTNKQLFGTVMLIIVTTAMLIFSWLGEAKHVQTPIDTLATRDWRAAKKFVHTCNGHVEVWEVGGNYRLRCVKAGG